MTARLRFRAAVADRTFRSLRHRNYRLYFYGQLVSFVGSWMQSAALAWLVYERTNDPFWPPLLLAAQVGPTLVLGPVGGSLADRFPKRTLILGTQIAFMLTAAFLTLAVASDFASPYLILVVVTANGLIQSLDLPIRLAYVPDLVPRADLINAVGLNSLLFNSARALGPAVAGVLFLIAAEVAKELPGTKAVTLGAVWCFLLNTLSYAAVLTALRKIDPAAVANTRVAGSAPGSIWDGVRYLRTRRPIGTLVILTGIFSTFGWPAMTLLPAYTKLVLAGDERAYSFLVSMIGAGALAAAVCTATFATARRQAALVAGGAALAAVGLAGLSVAGTLPAAAAGCGLIGFGLVLYLSTAQTVLQMDAPDATRGRVMALWAMTLGASAPVGHLTAGRLAQDFPVEWVLTGMAAGVGATAAAIAMLAAGGGLRAGVRT